MKKGFTFVEVLVGVGLAAIIFLGLYGAFQLGLKVVGQSKAKNIAIAVANQKIEQIRNLAYFDVGTTGAIPLGEIPQTEQITSNSLSFTINTSIAYIDDDFDDIFPDDSLPADYKKAQVKISWQSYYGGEVVLDTTITPKGIETEQGGGTLIISVFNASGLPVNQANVNVFNDQVSPAINANYTTDTYGRVILAGASTSTQGYKISASSTGYNEDRTYGTEEVTNPSKPHVSVFEGQTTEISFSIDEIGTFNVETRTMQSFDDSFDNYDKISNYYNTEVEDGQAVLIKVWGPSEGWWDEAYLHRKKVTFINSSRGDLYNVPVLIKLTSDNFDFSHILGQAKDLRFVDSDNLTDLDYEIEYFNKGQEQGYIWVRVPQIDGGSDTDHIFMYYDNPYASHSEDPEAVWDNNYVLVHHMENDDTGNINDSTSKNNDGTKLAEDEPIEVFEDMAAKAQHFDGNNDVITVPYNSSYDFKNDSFTIEAWLKPDIPAPSRECWIGAHDDSIIRKSLHLRLYDGITIRFGFYLDGLTASGPVQPGQWNYLAVNYTYSTDTSRVYFNGTLNSFGNNGPYEGDAPDITIGKREDEPFDGIIDEVRISSIDRSEDWISFQNCSMNQTCILYTDEDYIFSGENFTFVESGWLESIEVSPSNLIIWDRFVFNNHEPTMTDAKYYLYFTTSTVWSLIPDTDLTGNSVGFDVSSIDISGLDVNTYYRLKIRAELSSSDEMISSAIYDWHLTYNGGVVPDIEFHVQGLKTIGTDENEDPVYKYSQNHISDYTGYAYIPDLEWDSYNFTATTGLDMVETVPSQPVNLLPTEDKEVILYFTAENTLLVRVLDASTTDPIFGANVRLYKTGYDFSRPTDENGLTFFMPLDQETYNLEVVHQGYQDYAGFVNISGDIVETINMNYE